MILICCVVMGVFVSFVFVDFLVISYVVCGFCLCVALRVDFDLFVVLD